MSHVLYFEPRYSTTSADIWSTRGGHKYGNILGDLQSYARITLLMTVPPPRDDPYRLLLANTYGVEFQRIQTHDDPIGDAADEVVNALGDAIERLRPTIISNLQDRPVAHQYAMALSARRSGVRYVMRNASNTIEARARASEARKRPFYGTAAHITAMRHERIAAHLADTVIVTTDRERMRLGSVCVAPDKIGVCLRGVDLAQFAPNPVRPQRCTKFLFVGRQTPDSGYDILDEAIDQIESSGDDIAVTFAGAFTPGQPGIRRYLGFVEHADLADIYQQQHALVVCSKADALPQSIMEAMACGLPCILSRHLFETEFQHEANCLLVEPTADGVREAMQRLSADTELYQSLGCASLAYARKLFNQRDCRAQYRTLLLGATG
jgi:glycosyltransferase involved in cell wall biosynthesis